MSAFIPGASFCVGLVPYESKLHASRKHRHRFRRRVQLRATLSSGDDELRVRFKREVEEPKRSFFPESETKDTPMTPNERVLAQVRESMERLGVEQKPDSEKQPRPFKPIDISRVNPLSAYAGAAAAALISYVAWSVLGYIIQFFITHPLSDEIYVVQRLGAVVRTVLVCLFALGSGISGVTGLGLLLLAFRTTAAAVTGEFRDSEK